MLKYILRRVLFFIPTILIITLIGFILSVNAPGDPVERMVVAAQSGGEVGSQTVNQVEQKKFWRKKLGLDLPIFYISLSSYSKSDTLYKVFDKNERAALDRLVEQYGNWKEIQQYYLSIDKFYFDLIKLKLDTTLYKASEKNAVYETVNQLKFEALALKSSYDDNVIEAKLNKLQQLATYYPFLKDYEHALSNVRHEYLTVKTNATRWKNYIPAINYYPMNQYHRWLIGDGGVTSRGLWRGDFGISYVTKQPITQVISEKIGWSMFFSLMSVLLAYVISVPLGVKAGARKGSKFDKTSSIILFMLYSMPSFWVATLLLMTFANPDHFHLFPASGVKPAEGYPDGASLFEMIKISLPYVILPLICYTYSSFAFLSRTMRVSMIETTSQDYIRTARAKGLSESKVIWKHAFRNSLLPLITIFANVLPAAIGGSVILETIFTIPGMGSEMVYAIQNNNYPMIIAVLTIGSVLTLVGILISDILYAVVDPRISYSK